MISFPNGKINLGLQIISKGIDGYHGIETLFYPVQVCDALEVVPAKTYAQSQFSTSGLPLPNADKDNLCMKAYNLLKAAYPQVEGVRMHLHKVIPMGAGLGGGSSDGTATLILLNSVFGLGLSTSELEKLALRLGSDCPFFVRNKPVLASGRGEIFTDIELSLKAYELVLVYPGLHIGTAWAFSQVTPKKPDTPLQEILEMPPSEWKGSLLNDFEAPIAAAYPEIAVIRDLLYEKGAVYAALSGSGSTVFGIFAKGTTPDFDFKKEYRVMRSACRF